MTRSTMSWLKLSRVRSRGNLAQVLLRLMMVCNDITLAEDAWSSWVGDERPNRQGRQTNAKMYFFRLQIAHVYEAMEIIKQIAKHHLLAVEVCDVRTRGSFADLQAFLAHGDYRNISKGMRNAVTFHYTQPPVETSLASLASRHGDFSTTVSRGTEAYLWYFELADRVLDNIVVRQIWEIPLDDDVRAAADDIAVRLGRVREQFVDFAGNFVLHHIGLR
jgi:hypothetical protein